MSKYADGPVEFPDEPRKFIGRDGMMLLPSPKTVADMVAQIPAGQVTTTCRLRAALTERFDVDTTCRVTMKRSLLTAAAGSMDGGNAPCWRVISQKGCLIAGYPGGVQVQAALLRAEGVELDERGKFPAVANWKERLFTLSI